MNVASPVPQTMTHRPLLPAVALCFSLFATAATVLAGCSSSDSSPSSMSCKAGDTVACTCSGGGSGTQLCGASTCACPSGGGEDDASSTPIPEDSSTPTQDASAPVADAGAPGDGGHANDGAPPSSLYGACAIKGGFGWPCTVAGGSDPTNCTDPEFPYCFSGGQGSWCTKSCLSDPNACTTNVPDAGCAPTQCNARGYCK
ncbi:MAG TPA: hypothetical protein VGI39_15470 [Polyangiaceae bacterium]|jgi:hypothetical protein